MKLSCEECSGRCAATRRLRPCRHWRWLTLGRIAPVRKIRIVAMTEAIANGYAARTRTALCDDSRLHWSWYSVERVAFCPTDVHFALHETSVPASMNAYAL